MLSDPHEYVVITPIMERYLYLKTVTLIKDISRGFFSIGPKVFGKSVLD